VGKKLGKLGQKGRNRIPELKNGIWGPKSVWPWIYRVATSIENLTWSKKIYTFSCHKGENKPPEPKISMIV
jgi:hypothetical protein